MRFHSPEQLRRLADLARHAGLLFIADEIGTGFWRTGKLLACDWAGVVPDILCLGKSLTGGTLPMAVTMATTEVFAAFYSVLLFGDHLPPIAWAGMALIVGSGIAATILRARAAPQAPAQEH
jgi:adenosylmethionine-8-amino-7-oxononanoate aminotransferase